MSQFQIYSDGAISEGIHLQASKINFSDKKEGGSKVHIVFNHKGFTCCRPFDVQKSNAVLMKIWSHFGTVTNTHYSKDFCLCDVTFSTHEQAKIALEALRDEHRLHDILCEMVRTMWSDAQTVSILNQLFVLKNERLCFPSWPLAKRYGRPV